MSKPLGYYHYEYIKNRAVGHQWRIGDQDDDMVTDFPNKPQASVYVEQHNQEVRKLLAQPVFKKR